MKNKLKPKATAPAAKRAPKSASKSKKTADTSKVVVASKATSTKAKTVTVKAKTPPAKTKKRIAVDDPSSPGYRPPAELKGGVDRDKIRDKLDAADIKPPHSKKADDDFFVVGTIDLQNHHATVDFVIKQGVRQTADFIAEREDR